MNNATRIVDALGGTCEVARIFDISTPSVSQWKRRKTIPKARMQYIRKVFSRRLRKAGVAI